MSLLNRSSIAAVALIVTASVVAPAASSGATATPATGPTSGGTSLSGAVPVGPDVGFVDVSAGRGHNLGLGDDGRVYAWGDNFLGRLGDGISEAERAFSSVPVRVTTPAGVDRFTQISAGSYHSVALGDDGRAYAWGFPGTIGDGSLSGATVPVPVVTPPGVTRFKQVSAGDGYSLAVGDDGRVYGWGRGERERRLGTRVGPNGSWLVPVEIELPAGAGPVVAVSASVRRGVALTEDGRAFTWGGEMGKLIAPGQPFREPSALPLPVELPQGVSAFTGISAIGPRTLATGDDGRVYAWSNAMPLTVPYRLDSPASVTLTLTPSTSSYSDSVGVGSDGELYVWSDEQLSPTVTPRPSGVAAFVAGSTQLAVADDGRAYAWGSGRRGELGNGTAGPNVSSPTPVPVSSPTSAKPVHVVAVEVAGRPTTNVIQSDGTWTATTTESTTCGTPGDVVVSYTVGADPQVLTETTEGAFTYQGAAPTITSQPSGSSLTSGQVFTTSVVAHGDPGATVQWQSAPATTDTWADIPGATAPTLTTSPTTTTQYRAVATNCAGSTTSDPVSATVTTPPVQPPGPVEWAEAAVCTPGAPAPTGYRLLHGTARNDTLRGTEGPDLIRAGDGNDLVTSLGGDDIVCGGNGVDVITTGAGNDTAFGQAGADLVTSGVGDDFLHGGPGLDALDGSAGFDTAYPGVGIKLLLNIERRR